MSFGWMNEPLIKVQKVDSTTTAKFYNFAHKYENSNHSTATMSMDATTQMWLLVSRIMLNVWIRYRSRKRHTISSKVLLLVYLQWRVRMVPQRIQNEDITLLLTHLATMMCHRVGFRLHAPRPNTTPNTNPSPPVSWNDYLLTKDCWEQFGNIYKNEKS